VFWLSFCGIAYAYVGYPLGMWFLARFWRRSWKTAPIEPTVSIVLAVHDGAHLLAAQLQHLFTLDYPNISEIIVVSDGSADGTGELLARHRHALLKTIVLEEQRGKAAAVNAGVEQATGEIILFVDIRPQIAPGSIHCMMENFSDPTVGCVAGELVLSHEGQDSTAQAVGGIYWRYEQWIRKCEAAFDSPVGVYGGFYAIRRRLFTAYPAGIILDDMFQPLSVIRKGYRSVMDARAVVHDAWPKKVEGEFQRKVRTLAGNFQLFQLAPWILSTQNRVLFQLASHKAMRLIVPFLFLALLASSLYLSAYSVPFAYFACAQVLGWILALASLRFRIPGLARIGAPAGALLVLNAAAVAGLYRFLFTRGPLWKIWNTQMAPALKTGVRGEADAQAKRNVSGAVALK
jgi:cellulose synthase/poly-beta-1,6-N-acetylglucosamine synthase-like glycosyltransferase